MTYNSELLQKIIDVIDINVRPSLNMDGGDISVISLNGNVVSVKLHGACSCCPRASETLKHGVEQTLKQMVSENLIVKAV